MSDSHESGIPTLEELQTLPRWARVAFAARCAARAEPMLAKAWPHAPEQHLHAVRQAVDFARNTVLSINQIPASHIRTACSDKRRQPHKKYRGNQYYSMFNVDWHLFSISP